MGGLCERLEVTGVDDVYPSSLQESGEQVAVSAAASGMDADAAEELREQSGRREVSEQCCADVTRKPRS